MVQELRERVRKLVEEGYLYSEILAILKKEGDVDKKLKKELKEMAVPDELFYLFKSYLSCKQHLLNNKKDIVSRLGLKN